MLAAADDEVLFTASTEPTDVGVWRWGTTDGLSELTPPGGVHTAATGGGVHVIGSSGMDHDGTRWLLDDHVFESSAETPLLSPSVELLTVGPRQLRVGLLLPRDHEPGTPLPVLMDPYGGPHFLRVQQSRRLWLEPQWLADQGFAVIVADGRGTPGRGRAWARSVKGDLAHPALEDQVTALGEVAARHPGSRPVPGRRSAAGRSAAISRRWPFCAARMSSTPRSPGRRSPTGGSTTRSTPSATWAPIPTARTIGLRGSSLLDDASKLTATAAADPRPGRRQRGHRPYAAAVSALDRGGPSARGAAADRDHPHDAAGGGRGEPPDASGPVSQAGA